MTANEPGAPLSYDQLFIGFRDIAKNQGIIDREPIDAGLPPGIDGTLQSNGDQAYRYTFNLDEASLPAGIRGMGYCALEIEYGTEMVHDDMTVPERAEVSLAEPAGIVKQFLLKKKLAEVVLEVRVEALEPPESEGEPEDDLHDPALDEFRRGILKDLFSGKDHWLRTDGPAGDFARAMHVHLSPAGETAEEDVDRLRQVFAHLSSNS